MDVQSRFLSTTLQIWCYCGHVIKSRTMRHLNFVCQLNLSKSHKVWSSYLVSFRRSVEKFGWGRRKTPPPPCEIGLTKKGFHYSGINPGGALSRYAYGGVSPRNFQATQKYHFSFTATQKYHLILYLETSE